MIASYEIRSSNSVSSAFKYYIILRFYLTKYILNSKRQFQAYRRKTKNFKSTQGHRFVQLARTQTQPECPRPIYSLLRSNYHIMLHLYVPIVPFYFHAVGGLQTLFFPEILQLAYIFKF